MRTLPSLSSYTLYGIVVALVATGTLYGPLGLMSANEFPSDPVQAIVGPGVSAIAGTINVNRSRKTDRLPVTRANSGENEASVLKNVGAGGRLVRNSRNPPAEQKALELIDRKAHTPKPAPASLLYCEALASPVSDPILSRFIGRCFA